jgi:hypothetical protein
LLERLSAYVPDEFINAHWPSGPTGGRRRSFSAAQLWRVHLLALLLRAHALWHAPTQRPLLHELAPQQLEWTFMLKLVNRTYAVRSSDVHFDQ